MSKKVILPYIDIAWQKVVTRQNQYNVFFGKTQFGEENLVTQLQRIGQILRAYIMLKVHRRFKLAAQIYLIFFL